MALAERGLGGISGAACKVRATALTARIAELGTSESCYEHCQPFFPTESGATLSSQEFELLLELGERSGPLGCRSSLVVLAPQIASALCRDTASIKVRIASDRNSKA